MSPDIDTLNDALVEVVKALGGSKVVGVQLWPAKGIDGAQKQLLSCLNPERNEKLSLDEVVHIMRLGRDAGQHQAIDWLCSSLGYTKPEAIHHADQRASLQREFINATEQLARLAARIEVLGVRS